MFRPNTRCMWLRKAAKRTAFGKETFLSAIPIPCSIVHLIDSSAPSPIRTDSSASHGAAEENTASAKILVSPLTRVGRGDVLKIMGQSIEVKGVEQRMDVFGKLDHLELTGEIRADV